MAMATRIAFETRAGRAVRCVFLTNGAARGVSPAVRDAESVVVLARLGVPKTTVPQRHDPIALALSIGGQ